MKSAREIFAENLSTLLEKRDVERKVLADHLGVSEMTISNWTNGKKYPRIDKIQMIADFFNVKMSYLTSEAPSNITVIEPNFTKIPILGKIACGEPLLVAENIEGYTYEHTDSLPSGNIFSLVAKGDSMQPTIPDGSIVLLREQPDCESGEIAAVLLNGDTEAVLKRVKKQGDSIFLISDNQKYMPIIVNEQNPARIIGKAISYKVQL